MTNTITTLEDGFYATNPTATPMNVRIIEVEDGKVQLVNGNGKLWFTIPQFFAINTLQRRLEEDETVGL